MKGLRAKRVRMVKEGTLIATVDIGLTANTGYCTTLDGGDIKPFRFDNTKEGFEKFWCLTMANKNRFGCDEVVVGYESTGPYAEPLVHYLAHKKGTKRGRCPFHSVLLMASIPLIAMATPEWKR